MFSGDLGGTFNALQRQLRNLKLSLSRIPSLPNAVEGAPSASHVLTVTPRGGSRGNVVFNPDEQDEEEEEEGVQVVHFGVV